MVDFVIFKFLRTPHQGSVDAPPHKSVWPTPLAQLRTHARTHARNASAIEIDFPVRGIFLTKTSHPQPPLALPDYWIRACINHGREGPAYTALNPEGGICLLKEAIASFCGGKGAVICRGTHQKKNPFLAIAQPICKNNIMPSDSVPLP